MKGNDLCSCGIGPFSKILLIGTAQPLIPTSTVKKLGLRHVMPIVEGVFMFDKGASRANLMNHIQGQGLIADHNAVQYPLQPADVLRVHHQLGVIKGQPGFEAAATEDQIGPGEGAEGGIQCEFRGGLGVGELAVRDP